MASLTAGCMRTQGKEISCAAQTLKQTDRLGPLRRAFIGNMILLNFLSMFQRCGDGAVDLVQSGQKPLYSGVAVCGIPAYRQSRAVIADTPD